MSNLIRDLYHILTSVTLLFSPLNLPDLSLFSIKLVHLRSQISDAHHFYFARLVRLWNSLPVIDITLPDHIIKSKITDHLWVNFRANFDSNLPCSFHLLCPCNRCSKLPRNPSFQHLYIICYLISFVISWQLVATSYLLAISCFTRLYCLLSLYLMCLCVFCNCKVINITVTLHYITLQLSDVDAYQEFHFLIIIFVMTCSYPGSYPSLNHEKLYFKTEMKFAIIRMAVDIEPKVGSIVRTLLNRKSREWP